MFRQDHYLGYMRLHERIRSRKFCFSNKNVSLHSVSEIIEYIHGRVHGCQSQDLNSKLKISKFSFNI